MRKIALHISVVLMGILMAGCGSKMGKNALSSGVQIIETIPNMETVTNIGTSGETVVVKEENPRMVKLDDKIYVDTGETSKMLRCGVMDFEFDSSVNKGTPKKNKQTNFGKGYEGQYGTRKNRIEIYIDGEWQIFANNENNFDGVNIEVTNNTNTSLTLDIYNNSDCQVEYGEDFSIEKWDEEIQTWVPVDYKNTDFAFESIAICAGKGIVSKWTADWEYMYGELEPGKYRIVKEFIDSTEEGENTFYILTSEFKCE